MGKRLTFEELEDGKDYIAIGDNGKEYEAKAKLFENIGSLPGSVPGCGFPKRKI